MGGLGGGERIHDHPARFGDQTLPLGQGHPQGGLTGLWVDLPDIVARGQLLQILRVGKGDPHHPPSPRCRVGRLSFRGLELVGGHRQQRAGQTEQPGQPFQHMATVQSQNRLR